MTRVEPQLAAFAAAPARGFWREAAGRLIRNPLGIVGLLLITGMITAAIAAPLLAPYGPNDGALGDRLQGPSAEHPFGTDLQGRDELTRVLYGARISLFAGTVAVLLAVIAGGLLGCLAGGFPGKVDSIVMRVVDVLLSIPGILMAIGIVAWLGRGLPQIMLAVAIAYAPRFARLLRGSLMATREADYVLAARASGAGLGRVLFRHMLPNSITPVIVAATLSLGTAVIDVAGLGFLGLGPPDPAIPEWGTMLTDARQFLVRAPHLLLFPGAAIVACTFGFNLLGDALREALDPRTRR